MKIEIVNITKKFGEKEIFRDLSLTINSGDFTIISGESGCGKSTLLNMIGFLDAQFEGQIIYDNKEIKSRKEIRALLAEDISFVFQDFGLIDNLTVYDNLAILKCIKRLTKEKRLEAMNEVLLEVGLDAELYSKVCELSGGEQQRIAIAKAMLKKSRLILADEPVASLDYHNAKVVMQLLTKLNKNNVTVLLVTHQKELLTYGDQIIDIKEI